MFATNKARGFRLCADINKINDREIFVLDEDKVIDY